MKIFKGLDNLSPGRFGSPVVTIGTFDGVHVGHMAVISAVKELAAPTCRGTAVITFTTHPRTIVCGHTPRSIIPVHERLAIISRTGIESAILLEFDADLASMDPASFCSGILRGLVGASTVVLGHGARFGRGRGGDAALLREIGPSMGIDVIECPPVTVGGQPVSSSAIRRAVSEGNLGLASEMLGRPVCLIGTVVRGRGVGREIGFPTANLSLSHDVRPPEGVWRGKVSIEDKTWPCVISIGRAPTFGDGLPETVEVHVIGFEGELEGADLRVEVAGLLRGQERFADVAALVEAIRRDVDRAIALHDPTSASAPGIDLPLHGCLGQGVGRASR